MKIVIIEDDEILSKVLQEELAEAGYEVKQAFDGKKGIELAESEQPDLVLLDILLPQKDGFAVLDVMKKSPTTSAIPVIIISNLGSDEELKKGLAMGASDYIVKSQHTTAQVAELVKNFLAKKIDKDGAPMKPEANGRR